MIAFAITAYLRGGRDSDEDALYGSRTDEPQQLIAQRSWGLAGKATMVAAFAGVTIAVAARGAWWWPFATILAVAGFSYLLGLSNYGVGEESPGDHAHDGHQAIPGQPLTRSNPKARVRGSLRGLVEGHQIRPGH